MDKILRFCRIRGNVAFILALVLSFCLFPWLIMCSFTPEPAALSSAEDVLAESLYPVVLRPQRVAAESAPVVPTHPAIAMMDMTAMTRMTPAEMAALPTMTALPTMLPRDIMINGLFGPDGHDALVQSVRVRLERPETFVSIRQSYREDGAFLVLSLRFAAVNAEGVPGVYRADALSDLQGRLHRVYPFVEERTWPLRLNGVR